MHDSGHSNNRLLHRGWRIQRNERDSFFSVPCHASHAWNGEDGWLSTCIPDLVLASTYFAIHTYMPGSEREDDEVRSCYNTPPSHTHHHFLTLLFLPHEYFVRHSLLLICGLGVQADSRVLGPPSSVIRFLTTIRLSHILPSCQVITPSACSHRF